MSVAKVVEICAESNQSFEHAIQTGIETASKTIHHIRGAWVEGQKVEVRDGRITGYRVNLKLTFILDK
ncbi:MAG TPA: dodecin family protein [Gammaproteobacteria bacterium]